MSISMTGYTDIVIPRSGIRLIGNIKFCPHVYWSIIFENGETSTDLSDLGVYLKMHLGFDNRITVQETRFRPVRIKDKSNEKGKKDQSIQKADITPSVSRPNPTATISPPAGFPSRPPVHVRAPNFRYSPIERNTGTPTDRRNRHLEQRVNDTILALVSREVREMRQISRLVSF